MAFDIDSLNGQWHHIIHEFTGYSPTTKAGQPCPICSEPGDSKSNRFHYTNKHGNGTWLCRQCTPDGSDGLGLIARLNREDRKVTFGKIARKYDREDAPKYPKAEPEPEFIPAAASAEWDGKTLANKPGKKYDFSHRWKWNNTDGSHYGYVARLEFEKDGDKTKLCWQILHGYYEDQPDTIGWMQVAMNPKPLFGYPSCGLQGIDPNYIVIVEGEKTCMTAKQLLGPDYLVLCCQGGSSNVRSSDFKPLVDFAYSRELPIIAWGDNDEAGDKYADNIQSRLIECNTLSKKIRFEDKPAGWDAADASEDEAEKIKAAIMEAVSSKVEVKPEKNASDNTIAEKESVPASSTKSIDQLLRHVNPLGVCEGQYLFYPKNLKHVMAFSASAIMQAANMISVVGEDMLTDFFPKRDEEGVVVGYNTSAASKYLIRVCHDRGTYDPDLMRGIGTWKDSGKIVVNTGAGLVVDRAEVCYDDFKSNYTYAQPGTEKIKLGAELTAEDIEVIREVIYNFNWARPYHAHLMLGALVQAPIAAALRWRAHIWLIGAQGSGKSFFQSSFVRAILGQLCINFGGETTAAGVRQALKHNPFVVSFDEAEVRSDKDAKRMKDIISLARISSSDENTVVKGSATGDAMEYRCQSPFIMSSIKSCLREESDIARFAVVELSQPENTNEARESFARIKDLCYRIDAGFSERFIATCINKLPEIEQMIREVDIELAKKDLNARTRDQYGQLIGCAKLFAPDICLDDFDETLDEAREHTADQEPLRALNELLSYDIRIPSRYGDKTVTIAKAIELSCRLIELEDGFESEEIAERLYKYGMKVEDSYLWIANSCSEIEKILGYTDWNKLFKIIDGVEASRNTGCFGSRTYKSRYVKVPLDLLKKEEGSSTPFIKNQPRSSKINPVHQGLMNEIPLGDVGF